MAIEYQTPGNNQQQAQQMLEKYNRDHQIELTPVQHLEQALSGFLLTRAYFVEGTADAPVIGRAHDEEAGFAKQLVTQAIKRLNYAAVALIANGATTNSELQRLLYNTDNLPSKELYESNSITLDLATLSPEAKQTVIQVAERCISEEDMVVTFGLQNEMAASINELMPMQGLLRRYNKVNREHSPLRPLYRTGELYIGSKPYMDITPLFTRILSKLVTDAAAARNGLPNRLCNSFALEMQADSQQELSFSKATLTISRTSAN